MTRKEIEERQSAMEDESPTDKDIQDGVWEIAVQLARIVEALRGS